MLKSFKEKSSSDCNSSNVMFTGQYKSSKLLSIDDESSHPINGSNTNNKTERKRNINMMLLNDEDEGGCSDIDVGVGGAGGCDDNRKRIKFDDGQHEDNNKRKMYQVSTAEKVSIRFFSQIPHFKYI